MKTVGKYEICGLLGRGGMGIVYKARLPVIRKMVALKLLAPPRYLLNVLGEKEIQARFIAEASAMVTLRHPNLLEVLDFDFADGRPFFTMEYYYQNLGMLLGENRRAELPTRVLSVDKTIRYAGQMLKGLGRMHRGDMVHRDVKPYNLLVTDQDRVKIGDFGLSKLRGESFPNPPNVMVGSPYYAAPEQERDPEGVDLRADFYSVGVVLYRMLTGRLPEEEGFPLPSTCHPDVDAAWDAFVGKALSLDRENRFGSAEEMLEALKVLQGNWEKKKQSLCRLPPEKFSRTFHQENGTVFLRRDPVKVGPPRAMGIFQCDALYRPLHAASHRFQNTKSGDVVLDKTTGLAWQRGGSPDPMEWQIAHDYVRRLNEDRAEGFSHWRLPTVNELLSLIKPVTYGVDDCMEPLFDRSKRWLWSCDRRSFMAAWYVDGELGFTGWSDFTCQYHVRAVCCREMPFPLSDANVLVGKDWGEFPGRSASV